MEPDGAVDAGLSDEDTVMIEDQVVEQEDDVVDSVPMDVIIKAPVIYSWGRSDTDTLLRSPNEPPAIDGVQALTFANQRTIMQVGLML
jgi:hypothetical protein